ncbi:MAG: hypothetical protein JNJ73_21310 [Hyphomonadaceae bacterium]|nr:hypothetical protein [Hyphomonadaceae bacterium]
MAVVTVLEAPGVTQAQYDRCVEIISKGKGLKSLADWPVPGILMHSASVTPTGLRVVDVWESEAAFQAFGAVLGPALKEVNFPDVAPQVTPAYKFIKA